MRKYIIEIDLVGTNVKSSIFTLSFKKFTKEATQLRRQKNRFMY